MGFSLCDMISYREKKKKKYVLSSVAFSFPFSHAQEIKPLPEYGSYSLLAKQHLGLFGFFLSPNIGMFSDLKFETVCSISKENN